MTLTPEQREHLNTLPAPGWIGNGLRWQDVLAYIEALEAEREVFDRIAAVALAACDWETGEFLVEEKLPAFNRLLAAIKALTPKDLERCRKAVE